MSLKEDITNEHQALDENVRVKKFWMILSVHY